VGQEPREIEREIEATRDRLTASVDALVERVDPREVARRTAGSAKERFLSTVRRATGR
jgi:hypothetical protein